LATVHILYGNAVANDPERIEEIRTLAQILTKHSHKEDKSYILLGDFNIFNNYEERGEEILEDDTMTALQEEVFIGTGKNKKSIGGFYIPKNIRKHPTDVSSKTRYYNQIAFNLKLDDNMTVFSEKDQKSGAFDWSESVYRLEDWETYADYYRDKVKENDNPKKLQSYFKTYYRSWQMSDHLPLWVELKIDFSNQYLEKVKGQIV
jgi:exonuclease III